jgi:hypothetical protein
MTYPGHGTNTKESSEVKSIVCLLQKLSTKQGLTGVQWDRRKGYNNILIVL